MNHAVVILWVLSSLQVGSQQSIPMDAGTILAEICDYVHELQNKTQGLLDTYLSNQGAPFNGSDFSARQLQLGGLPKAAIPYRAWRILNDEQRVLRNFEAYSVFDEYFQLVQDDQRQLNPHQPGLQALLGQVRADLGRLREHLASALASFRLATPPPAEDPLSSLDPHSSPFQKKLRGYLVCREYRLWLGRTQRSFSLLRSKY